MMQEKTLIGRTANMQIVAENDLMVPVKIDTGADSSSIWASDIVITGDNQLEFVLFDKSSQYYTGKKHRSHHYGVQYVRSSNGTAQVRYRVQLSVRIGGRLVRGTFTLADRSKNKFPVLIGCRLLNKRFIVDVSKDPHKRRPHPRSNSLTEELKKDPQAFYKKYHANNQRGDTEL